MFPCGFAFVVGGGWDFAVGVRHGESEQTDGFGCVVHFLDEAFGFGQDGLHGDEDVGAGGTACYLAEVVELDFQC